MRKSGVLASRFYFGLSVDGVDFIGKFASIGYPVSRAYPFTSVVGLRQLYFTGGTDGTEKRQPLNPRLSQRSPASFMKT
ncbi:MAG: hypothetical protein AAFQ55_17485, partial [Pseudomonadota bacterium]